MALPASGPISFADFNTELSRTAGSQIDMQSTGQIFELDIDQTTWSDTTFGLGMDEFYGLDIDDIYSSPSGPGVG